MKRKNNYPECEKRWVFRVLILVAGFYGGYAMMVRGGAFSNAQTGNLALMAIALGTGKWMGALYYLIPISAYLLGSIVSEVLPKPLGKTRTLRWCTLLTLFEMVAVIVMGFIPATAPHQICQIIINFICAMQFNTFRQAEGMAMATTFCTNHIRQIGVYLAGLFDKQKQKKEQLQKATVYILMVVFFIAGVAAAAVACTWLGTYAIWLTLIPLAVLAVDLLHADIKAQKDSAAKSCCEQ